MAELLVAPSALLVAVTVLRDGLSVRDPQPVYTRVPAERPKRFVTVSRAGGQLINPFTESILLIIQTWDDDKVMGEARAEQTANLCVGLMRASSGTRVTTLNDTAKIRWWEQNALPSWLPDPDIGIPRFQFTGELRLAVGQQ